MNIPQLILVFIENQTVASPMLLPFRYTKGDEWERFQHLGQQWFLYDGSPNLSFQKFPFFFTFD
ncbi:hypothetical protein [Chitinophaga sp. CF418]|uniref:hypothetical protein n=1 Tax=Chitinophaga sp. CF418 TaxID=1855287 RepID=UPI0009226127|nr:hypothetical protein [Chitinophaga sp. CF418]SHN09927.1 hypothetical protein SAMN05216311_105141 [Chitinophaga sp. CF418]